MVVTDDTSQLPQNILRIADSVSMAHKIEVRVPFVDSRLADIAFFNTEKLIEGGSTKVPLRKRYESILKDAGINQPPKKKYGFNFPASEFGLGGDAPHQSTEHDLYATRALIKWKKQNFR